MGYDSKGILVLNLKYEHAISFINLVKFIYQMPRSISSKLFVIASGGGEANVYGSSYYWNFRISSFKQVACLILSKHKFNNTILLRYVPTLSVLLVLLRSVTSRYIRYVVVNVQILLMFIHMPKIIVQLKNVTGCLNQCLH